MSKEIVKIALIGAGELLQPKKEFSKREVTTILAGLRYLQANRDDAIEAMSDFDDATGTETKPSFLTGEEIDKLCERINLSKTPI